VTGAREGSPGRPAAESRTTGQVGCGLQRARSHRTTELGGDSSRRAGHKAERPAAVLSVRRGDGVTARRVTHQEGFVHDRECLQVRVGEAGGAEVTAESPAGLSTTLLSTGLRLPSSPAPQSIAQCSCRHRPTLTKLLPSPWGCLSPSFHPDTPLSPSPPRWCRGEQCPASG